MNIFRDDIIRIKVLKVALFMSPRASNTNYFRILRGRTLPNSDDTFATWLPEEKDAFDGGTNDLSWHEFTVAILKDSCS